MILTAASSNPPVRTSFAYSFPFLPGPRRRALETVYAFCRASDDIVDGPGSAEEKRSRLDRWKRDLSGAFSIGSGSSGEPLLAELAGVSGEYGIPASLFHDLVRGVEMDLGPSRYRSFEELRSYCHLVASTVGLMCLDIFGRRNARTEEYARTVGIALQLTNIIRDVGTDAGMGRIYLPLDDLDAFGCSAGDILARRDSDGFRRLVAFQTERAEGYYKKAGSLLDGSDQSAMRPARIMEEIYHRILRKIGDSGYDVLGRTIRLSRPAQLGVAIRYGILGKFFAE